MILERLENDEHVAFPLALDPFVLTRLEMAQYALNPKAAGIDYIGSCCGSAPHNIRAMAEALGRTVPNSKYTPALDLHSVIGDTSDAKESDPRILCEQRYGKAHCHFLEKEI